MKFADTILKNKTSAIDGSAGYLNDALDASKIRRKLEKKPFFIKLFNWEFWPFQILYFPAFLYYAYLIIKARTPFYFSSSNPGLENGGMLGESKYRLYQQIRKDIQPETLFFKSGEDNSNLIEFLKNSSINYPLIVKPNIGERGWGVKKIKNELELLAYASESKVDFLVQEFIKHPVELGVFYYRYPGQKKGIISSITQKGFLHITGDGRSTLEELIKRNKRGLLHFNSLKNSLGNRMSYVPEQGEVVMLEEIGNHCKGTAFLDLNYEIDEQLTDAIDSVAQEIDGFYFGRFDLRCQSVEDLRGLKNFKIIELNGSGAEPGHIYHPGASLKNAYKVIIHHMKVMYEISMINKSNGYKFMSFKEGFKLWKKVRNYNKLKAA